MMRAFRSEWTKLARSGQVLGSWGPMVGFAILFGILFFALAGNGLGEDEGAPPGFGKTTFEAPDGGVYTFGITGGLIGIVALVIAAANMATEYTAGTLKVLLVREPRRLVLLAGKTAALAAFVSLGILLALVASVATSFGMAIREGIAVEAWGTTEGLGALADAFVHVTLAGWVWILFGLMLATVFRSGFAAVGIGIGYPMVVEAILQLVLPKVARWMPGSVLGRFMAGDAAEQVTGAGSLTYAEAGVLSLAYAVVFLAVTSVLLQRRDVV